MVRHAVYICFPSNPKCLIWQTIMCCSFRTWWRKPARRRVCKRQATPRCGTTANSGASPPRGSALRHLAPTTSQPWMCQQDTGQVTAGLTITWWQPQFSIHCSVLLSGTQHRCGERHGSVTFYRDVGQLTRDLRFLREHIQCVLHYIKG